MELILTNSRAVDGYDPTTGKLLECLGGAVASSAAHADGIVFVSSEDAGLSAIDIGGHGEQSKVLWRWDAALPDAASPLAKDGYVILPAGFGVVSCLDAKIGTLLSEKELERGFWSSPVLAKGRVYLIDSHGATQVFRLAELLGASGSGEAAYATPAIVGDRIYIRGLTHPFCIAARPAPSAELRKVGGVGHHSIQSHGIRRSSIAFAFAFAAGCAWGIALAAADWAQWLANRPRHGRFSR